MCMFVSDPYPKTAKNNITCYKVLTQIGDAVITPFRQRYICSANDLDELKGMHLVVSSLNTPHKVDNNYAIEEGFIHTYQEFILDDVSPHSIVLKCHIPRHAPYYEDDECFCSRTIVVDEIMQTAEYPLPKDLMFKGGVLSV